MNLWKRVLAGLRQNASYYVFSMVVTVIVSPVFALLLHPHGSVLRGLASGTLSGLAGAICASARLRYLNYLQRRAGEQDSGKWDVRVNSVTVGSISDAEYAAIRRKVYGDNLIWMGQLVWMVKRAFGLCSHVLQTLPIALVWGAIAGAIFVPDQIISCFSTLAHATPAELSTAMINTVTFGLGMILVSVLVMMALRGTLTRGGGAFDKAVAYELRRRLGVAAEGNIDLCRVAGNDVAWYNEDDWKLLRRDQS